MATSPHVSAQSHAAGFSPRQRTIALVIVSLAFVMDLLDSTITNIAIPSIRLNLTASYAAIQWVVAGYSLAFAILLVTGGRMGDVFGYKKLFIVGISGFTIASLLSGISPDIGVLIGARLFQGAMAALMVPQVISLMQIMYKPEERGPINGLFGALGGVAASLGPVIGGLLIKANLFSLDWRPIFLINVPIGIFGILAAIKYLPNGKSTHPLKLDITGTIIIMVALLLLIFPLIQGRELGWPSWTILMMVASIPFFAVFIWWQKRKERLDGSPLVVPSLFKNRSFPIGLTINMVFEMAMIGFFLTFGLLIQIGLGYSAIHAALTGLPTAIGITLIMAVAGQKLIPRLGRYSLSIGTVVMALGLTTTLLVIHHFNSATNSWELAPGLVVVGIGMGFVFSSLFAAVLNGVDPRHAGSASGLLNAVQQIGGAIGVALIGVIFFGQLSQAAPASFVKAEPALVSSMDAEHIPVQAQTAIIAGVKQCFVDRSTEQDSSVVPASCKDTASSTTSPANKTINAAIANSALKANTNNFVTAFKWAMVFTAGLLALSFALTFLLPAKFKTEAYEEL